MTPSNKLQKLLLHHLKRNQIKDRLIEIDKEFDFYKKQSFIARKNLKSEKEDVEKLESRKFKKIRINNQRQFENKLNKEKREEQEAFDLYEGILDSIEKIKEEKVALIELFKSMENVEKQLIEEASLKEKRLRDRVDFARKINIIKLKRENFLKIEIQ